MAVGAVRPWDKPLESLLFATKGADDVGLIQREELGAEKIAQRSAKEGGWIFAEPSLIGLIREAAEEVFVPVGQHRGHVVYHAENVFRRASITGVIHSPDLSAQFG